MIGLLAGLGVLAALTLPSASGLAASRAVDVRAYGARGNGVHDDTAAIRRAMNAVAALGGGTVRLPQGIFRVTAVTVPDHVRLVGDGPGRSWIRGRVTARSDVTLRELRIGTRGVAFHLAANAHRSTFDHCQFRGGGGTGDDECVVFLGGHPGSNVSDVSFIDCNIERNLGTENESFTNGYNNVGVCEKGDISGGAHIEHLTFDGCHFGVSNGVATGCPRMDFEAYTNWNGTYTLHGWHDITINGCVFEIADYMNVDLPDAPLQNGERASGPATITNNIFKGGKYYDLCIESAHDVLVEGNTFYRGGEHVIKFGVISL